MPPSGIDVHARVRADRRGRQDEAVVGVGLEAGAREDLRPLAVLAVLAATPSAQPALLPFRYAVSISTARISDRATSR